jgi:hypothetical protein
VPDGGLKLLRISLGLISVTMRSLSGNEGFALSEIVDRKSVPVPKTVESRAAWMALGNPYTDIMLVPCVASHGCPWQSLSLCPSCCDRYVVEGVLIGELLDSKVVVLECK